MSRKKVVASNQLLLREWNFKKNSILGIDPNIVTLGSGRKVFWICSVCGNEWSMRIAARDMGQGCNSKKCISEKKKSTFIRKYGVENPLLMEEVKDKIKKTCIHKYGVENPFQSNEIKKKIKKTCFDRYGVANPSQNSDIREKAEKTCIERYGVNYPLKSESIREKVKETCIKKYGFENPSQVQEFKEKKEKTTFGKIGKKHHWEKDYCEKSDRAEYNKKYKGGFVNSLKRKIKERDNFECQCPYCLNKTNKILVHHIDNVKENNNDENLITLCFSCHSKVTMARNEKIQEYIDIFYQIVKKKYT